MSEEQLNENFIRNKIQGICQDCIYLDKIVPIINQMLKESYIDGLKQGKFDKEAEKQQLISFLENKIKKQKFDERLTYKQIEINACVRNAFQEVLDFVNKGGKDE